nr:MAG TPA: hypothetical protein [Caudoviricetes sp.]
MEYMLSTCGLNRVKTIYFLSSFTLIVKKCKDL